MFKRPISAILFYSLLFGLLFSGLTVMAQSAVPTQPPAQTPLGAQPADAQPPNAQPQTEGDGAGERIITITYDGGTRSSPDLRYGPYVYEHPDPDGIAASVSNLEIFAQRGELRAPDEVLIAEAEGEREASFSGGVRGRARTAHRDRTGARLQRSDRARRDAPKNRHRRPARRGG